MGDNDWMSKRFCSNPVLCFVWWSKYTWLRVIYKVQTHVLKVHSVHSIHSLWKYKWMATYMQRMRNNNLEIRIAGSSCRPWLSLVYTNTNMLIYILANFLWVKLMHEIFVLLWQEFLKASQLLLQMSSNCPKTSKLCQKMCEVVLTIFEQF